MTKPYFPYILIRMANKRKKSKKEAWFLKEYIFIPFFLILSFIIRLSILKDIENGGWLSTQLMAGTDMTTFDSQAQSILKGENVIFASATSVLYPYFVAFVYSFFGRNLHSVYIIQTIIALFSYFLLYLTTKRLFDKNVGIITFILSLFYGPFILYEDSLLIDGLFTSFVSIILYFLVRLQEKPSGKNGFLLGLIIGISALLRGTVLTFIPFLFVLSLILFRLRKGILISFFIIIGSITPIIPITIKNYIDTKEFIFLSSKGGTQFYIGNNPGSTGHSDSYTENHNEITERINKEPSISKRSSLWMKESLRFIKNSPSAWLSLTLKKAWLFWDSWEIPNNVDYSNFKNFSKVMSLFFKFSLIAPLCLLGLILSIKRKAVLGLIFFILSYFLTTTAFMVLGRYRIGVLPSLLPFGGYAIFYLYNQRKEIKTIIPCFLLFSLLFIGVNFSSTLKKYIYPLLYKDGIETEKDGYLYIMDAPEEGGNRETFTLNNPNRVIKKELIIKDISKIKDNCFFFFDFFGGPGLISIEINEKPLGKTPCPSSGGLLIFGKAGVPISMLRNGINTISLRAMEGSFEIPLEKVLRYSRSFISEDAGKGWERIDRGEFTIRFKLKLK
ncbi:MAG: glycosyltransferase family 39 protein [bacterium]